MNGLYRAARVTDRGPFVCGFVVERGRVVRAAPYIARSVLGRPWDTACRILRRAWKVEYLGE